MTQHTPGPWKVVLHGRAAYVSIYHPLGLPRETGWAEFSVQPYSQPAQAEANARLIAAAPDLLAALQMIDADWTKEWPDGPETKMRLGCSFSDETLAFWLAARAAIAKATQS